MNIATNTHICLRHSKSILMRTEMQEAFVEFAKLLHFLCISYSFILNNNNNNNITTTITSEYYEMNDERELNTRVFDGCLRLTPAAFRLLKPHSGDVGMFIDD